MSCHLPRGFTRPGPHTQPHVFWSNLSFGTDVEFEIHTAPSHHTLRHRRWRKRPRESNLCPPHPPATLMTHSKVSGQAPGRDPHRSILDPPQLMCKISGGIEIVSLRLYEFFISHSIKHELDSHIAKISPKKNHWFPIFLSSTLRVPKKKGPPVSFSTELCHPSHFFSQTVRGKITLVLATTVRIPVFYKNLHPGNLNEIHLQR